MARPPNTANYQELDADEDSLDSRMPFEPTTELQPNSVTWDHIHNLDDFFQKIYYYHQHAGILNIILEGIYSVSKLIIVFFVVSVGLQCVNYAHLFHPDDIIKDWDDFLDFSHLFQVSVLNVFLWITFLLAFLLFTMPLIVHIRGYWDVRRFLHEVLKITETELNDLTWNELEVKLLSLQKVMRLCVHKAELDSLDIHNRILRHENYLIGMMNKDVLPTSVKLPCLGLVTFFSKGYLYNIKWLLFRLPKAPFLHSWQLKPIYKMQHQRLTLAEELSHQILLLGLVNLIFSPLIFIIQLLFYFFENGERVKSQPGHLFVRCWSNYALFSLRHFNELKHELRARLNLARRPADHYVNCFVDRVFVTTARIFAFLGSSIALSLGFLLLIREPVSHSPGFLALFTFAGLLARNSFGFIPDDGVVWLPEALLQDVAKFVHYYPDHWRGSAHTKKIRAEFQQLFVFRIQIIMEEIFSPIIAPFWLLFVLRPKALEIVDFLRNYTVDDPGVGDICSFATFNITRHGHPLWEVGSEQTLESSYHGKVENGKLEKSLMNFHLCNPSWKPSAENGSLRYLQTVKKEMVHDIGNSSFPLQSALRTTNGEMDYNTSQLLQPMIVQSMYQSMASFHERSLLESSSQRPSHNVAMKGNVRGLVGSNRYAVSQENSSEIPTAAFSFQSAVAESMLNSLQQEGITESPLASFYRQQQSMTMSSFPNGSSATAAPGGSLLDSVGQREIVNADLCNSMLYLHELHWRKKRQQETSRSTAYQSASQFMQSTLTGRGLAPIYEPDESRDEAAAAAEEAGGHPFTDYNQSSHKPNKNFLV